MRWHISQLMNAFKEGVLTCQIPSPTFTLINDFPIPRSRYFCELLYWWQSSFLFCWTLALIGFWSKVMFDHKFRLQWFTNQTRRICPGRHVANNSMFIMIARLLWAATIKPVEDDHGKPIMPDTEGFVNMGLILRVPIMFTRLLNAHILHHIDVLSRSNVI